MYINQTDRLENRAKKAVAIRTKREEEQEENIKIDHEIIITK